MYKMGKNLIMTQSKGENLLFVFYFYNSKGQTEESFILLKIDFLEFRQNWDSYLRPTRS